MNTQRKRKSNLLNLQLIETIDFSEEFEIPIVKNDGVIPDRLISFRQINTVRKTDVGIHFFIDDYKFESLWRCPQRYLKRLSDFKCIFTPDFSVYWDMPFPMQLWNVYRSRFIGQWLQHEGLKVIPTLTWADADTFDYCFQGVEKGCVVAVSTVGSRRNQNSIRIWKNGMDELINRIEPSAILIYGEPMKYDYGGIMIKYYQNDVIERRQSCGR